jgi:hypothetical protein
MFSVEFHSLRIQKMKVRFKIKKFFFCFQRKFFDFNEEERDEENEDIDRNLRYSSNLF